MEWIESMSTTGWVVIAAALIIIMLVMFSKAIKFILKLAVVAVMLIFIAYFLQQAGLISLP